MKLMQSTEDPTKPYTLGYRILLYISHEAPTMTSEIAKICGKNKGDGKRVMTSLANRGLVRRLLMGTTVRSCHGINISLREIIVLGREPFEHIEYHICPLPTSIGS